MEGISPHFHKDNHTAEPRDPFSVFFFFFFRTMAHGKMSAGPRRALSGIPIRKAGLQGHEGSSLRETFRQSDGQKTERGRKKEAKPHQKEERKKDVVFKNSFMKRSRGERGGGRRRRGLFPPPKNKNSQKNRGETSPQRSCSLGI